MFRILTCAIVALVASAPCWAQPDQGGNPLVPADGMIEFEPPQAVSCIAVRVSVPEGKMIVGLRWFNGTASESFPRILVASGNGDMPPPYTEAVVAASEVLGEDQAWSEVTFATPVASQSGTLFALIEYPENYAPQLGQAVLGVGYVNAQAPHWYFVTGDGDTWIKVVSNCRVLLEPVLADRTPGVIDKSARPQDNEPALCAEFGLFAAPNPFNPEAKIDLYLPAATSGTVKIFDVRGYLVAELHRGNLARGQNRFVWTGTDNGGRTAASGVYWVLAQTLDQKFTKKLLLIK